MIFDWVWKRFFEIVMLTTALILITFSVWCFLEAIAPYQAAQQGFYLR